MGDPRRCRACGRPFEFLRLTLGAGNICRADVAVSKLSTEATLCAYFKPLTPVIAKSGSATDRSGAPCCRRNSAAGVLCRVASLGLQSRGPAPGAPPLLPVSRPHVRSAHGRSPELLGDLAEKLTGHGRPVSCWPKQVARLRPHGRHHRTPSLHRLRSKLRKGYATFLDAVTC